MYLAKVYVTYKTSILDPKGEAVKDALHRLDYSEVENVVMGKYFELTIKKSSTAVEETVEHICDQLLANINMESYRYEITEMEGA